MKVVITVARKGRFKRFLKALGIAFLGIFYDVRISRKGRVSLRLRDNKQERATSKRIKRRINGST
jgi:hypothetical protein